MLVFANCECLSCFIVAMVFHCFSFEFVDREMAKTRNGICTKVCLFTSGGAINFYGESRFLLKAAVSEIKAVCIEFLRA